MTVGEFFGTLQQSITDEWRKHLQTSKYSAHMALDEFYKEMPELVDVVIEGWQADNDKVFDYQCLIDAKDYDALGYLEKLKEITIEGRKLMTDTGLESDVDAIISLINSTIYKLKHLTESRKTLSKLLSESIFDKEIPMGEVIATNVKLLEFINRLNSKHKRTQDSFGNEFREGDAIVIFDDLRKIRLGVVTEIYRGGLIVKVTDGMPSKNGVLYVSTVTPCLKIDTNNLPVFLKFIKAMM